VRGEDEGETEGKAVAMVAGDEERKALLAKGNVVSAAQCQKVEWLSAERGQDVEMESEDWSDARWKVRVDKRKVEVEKPSTALRSTGGVNVDGM
jgi:hypothetical protein